MDLNEYHRQLRTKDGCPSDCEFASRSDVALVPPPDTIQSIIVSRDPTVDWKPVYEYATTNCGSEVCRKMLFASAIPASLLAKVQVFLEEKKYRAIQGRLPSLLFEGTYWTHLHKCFTNPRDAPFKMKNAKRCADTWLKRELEYAIGAETVFVIALGDHVHSWIQEWSEGHKGGVRVIYLPHPSGQNNAIWYRSTKASINKRLKAQIQNTEKELKRLASLVESMDKPRHRRA